jgi:mRNA-degrading endonuclease toxin of MazEF toxin-antitoxin module
MPIQPGEFWVADIVFTDASASKKRPVLVLWLDAADAVCAVVTSAPPRTATDVSLANWQTSGLRVASTVRLSRLDCLEQSLFLHRLGALSPADAKQIKTVWQSHIKPQF